MVKISYDTHLSSSEYSDHFNSQAHSKSPLRYMGNVSSCIFSIWSYISIIFFPSNDHQ